MAGCLAALRQAAGHHMHPGGNGNGNAKRRVLDPRAETQHEVTIYSFVQALFVLAINCLCVLSVCRAAGALLYKVPDTGQGLHSNPAACGVWSEERSLCGRIAEEETNSMAKHVLGCSLANVSEHRGGRGIH